MRTSLAMLAICAGACIGTRTVPCGDGVCAEDHVCAHVAVSVDLEPVAFCVAPPQLAACKLSQAGDPCSPDPQAVPPIAGTCHDGVCFPDACGNQLVDRGEVCDDGNTVAADGCSADCRSDELCRNAVTDALVGEDCDDGNVIGHDGCTTRCVSERPQWSRQNDPTPPQTTMYALAFDPIRHRVVTFGGEKSGGVAFDVTGETHEWDGLRWFAPQPPIFPLPRQQGAMVYDVARAVVVLFGGSNGQNLDDTWTWNGAAWAQQVAPDRPPARDGHAIAYDPIRELVIVYGGGGQGRFANDDTWAWDGAAWHQLTGSAPPARRDHAMAFDPARGAVVMFGGRAISGRLDDTWELTESGWVERTPVVRPPPRSRHAMTVDPRTGRVVILGGTEGITVGGTVTASAWAWSGASWTPAVELDLPNAMADHQVVTDPIEGSLYMLTTAAPDEGTLARWRPGGWVELVKQTTIATMIPQFSARRGHVAVVDRARRELVVFGGQTQGPGTILSNDTFLWNGRWTAVVPSGPFVPPPARTEHAGAHNGQSLTVFGGRNIFGLMLADTWMFSRTSGWTQKLTATKPTPRAGHAMTYDDTRQVAVLFGGHNAGGVSNAETWTFDGSDWTQRSVPGPPRRTAAAMVFDPIRRRVVLLGGRDGSQFFADAWEWDGDTWTEITAATTVAPAARFAAAAAWDAARKRIVMFGGQVGGLVAGQLVRDAWEAAWDDPTHTLRWTQLAADAPPLARTGHAMVGALDGGGVLVIGGSPTLDPSLALNDVQLLRWDGASAYEACGDVDTDDDGLVGCGDPDCWSRCSPFCPIGVTSCADGLSRCGDGTCNLAVESCYLCPGDCMPCELSCGDFTCTPPEDATSCPGDCS